jgi:chromate transport protein ChrA
MFHDALRNGVSDNASRAVAVGRFFATVNVTSCALQIFVLPSILSVQTLPQVLRAMPGLIMLTTILGHLKPSLEAVMISFGNIYI